MHEPALLALEDGSLFHGRAIGASGRTVGEVVFNTAMTGYQEILTDPSYHQQIVTLTYPHIGNVGCNPEDAESGRVHAAGLVVRDLPRLASNWRQQQSLGDYLRAHGLVAIADIDTRRLTRHLRVHGALKGCIEAGPAPDAAAAVAAARGFPGLQGADLAQVVSVTQAYRFTEPSWVGPGSVTTPATGTYKVVVYDFGVKRNILRLLVDRGCQVEVVPARTPASEVLAGQPDGVLLSNGPGDPEPCDYAIEATRALLAARLPLFGICLGHQILGLALGGRTEKMRTGHHGANHPVQDLATQRVFITSQNHGFAVAADSLPEGVLVTHKSLFDGSVQGIAHRDYPAFGFQGHPEASPGPHDIQYLFDRFIASMAARQTSAG